MPRSRLKTLNTKVEFIPSKVCARSEYYMEATISVKDWIESRPKSQNMPLTNSFVKESKSIINLSTSMRLQTTSVTQNRIHIVMTRLKKLENLSE